MKSQRLLSLDVLRGLTVALMILVNNPGSWGHIHPPLRHAVWHGWTPTDLVFPFFLFAVGVALALSFARRIAAGAGRGALARKVVSRAALIFLLGLMLNGFPYDNLGAIRVWGVLQRIALCYLGAGLTIVFISGLPGRVAVLAGLFLVYELLMRLPLVPGWGHGSFALADNFARWIDLGWPGAKHLYRVGEVSFDPEGLVSSLPATAGTLAGFLAGEYLRSDRPLRHRLGRLLAAGCVVTGGGFLFQLYEPVNKQLWTVSYTVLTTGLALVFLAGCAWIIDVRGWQRWFRPALVFGSNPLIAFVGSGLLARILVLIRVSGPDGAAIPLKTLIYRQACLSWASPVNASLVFALLTVVFWWAVLWLLYRRKIFIRV